MAFLEGDAGMMWWLYPLLVVGVVVGIIAFIWLVAMFMPGDWWR
jgi:hypothetical protein